MIQVTFWGTEFFESEEGEQVQYGSTVSATILRQVDPDRSKDIENFANLVMTVLMGLLLLIFFLAGLIGGSLLPIWIFLTTLSVIVHTILFSMHFPMEPFVVLKTILKYLRLDLVQISQMDLKSVDVNDEKLPVEFILAGYHSHLLAYSLTDLV